MKSAALAAFVLGSAVLAMASVAEAQEAAAKPPVFESQTRLAWHKQHLEMREQSPFKDLVWEHIGPMQMSGRITDIAKPLDQPFTFYVASASGGVWKTTDEGTEWKPIFDDAPSGSVGAIAVDPSNSNTIWVGLGEANIFRSSMSGTGVYKSEDEGKTWQHMGLAESHHIARILIRPDDSKVVYVAASGREYSANPERGVYKSTDGGANWERVLFEDEMTGAIDLAMDPKNPDTLYASMWHRIRRPWNDPKPGPGGGIYKTTDGGGTWKRLTNGFPDRDVVGRMGVAVAASSPNVVYVLADNHEIARAARDGELDAYGRQREGVIKGAEVYRSDDYGETWTKPTRSNRTLRRLFSTYGWVFGQIRVDPNDANTVYAMGIPLLKSTDGGQSFQTLDYRGLHGDHHALWIDPSNSNYIINGNDGGINISYDGGQSWKNLENLPVVQFYNVAVDNASPFNVYGSIQDNNTWMGPSTHRPGESNPAQWKTVPGGEASYVAVDPLDSNTMYSESFYGSIMRTDLAAKKTKNIKPKAGEGEPPLRGQWLAPFLLSPHNSRVVYHGMQYVFRSMDRGDNWERISSDLSYNDPEKLGNISFATITTLSESPLKFGLLYAGTDDGRVHMTRDGGDHWIEIIAGLPKFKWVSRVVASQFDLATVYLTLNGKTDNDFQVYVYRSTDYGQNWQDISDGIPGGPVNVIKEDPFSKDVLYVGTDLGVYVTTDGAKTWHVLGSGLPITFVHDLVLHERDKILVIATHGRGMFTVDASSIGRSQEAEGRTQQTGSKTP